MATKVYTPGFTNQQLAFYEKVATACGFKAGHCVKGCEFKIVGLPDDEDEMLVILMHRAAGSGMSAHVTLGSFERAPTLNNDIVSAIKRAVPTLVENHEVWQ